jgi:hypothetical protein
MNVKKPWWPILDNCLAFGNITAKTIGRGSSRMNGLDEFLLPAWAAFGQPMRAIEIRPTRSQKGENPWKSASPMQFSIISLILGLNNYIAEGIGMPFRKYDMTLPAGRRTFNEQFSEEDLVIVGLPVYVGRIPMCLDDLYAQLIGHSTQAIAVVVYGNREYNDALIELKMELESHGFNVRSAALQIMPSFHRNALLQFF